MNRILLAAVAVSFMFGLISPALAQDEKKKKKNQAVDVSAFFTKLDANNDKKLSKEEFNAFKGLQTPKPGKENKEPKGLADARNAWFAKLDANSDGFLTAEEFGKIKDVMAASPAKKKKVK
jgi:Ca2+-binding EF-hand superfamily protein